MTEFRLEESIEILRTTPATLRSLLGGLSDAWIRSDEGPDTWTAYDVVGHLIHGEKTDWIDRLQTILEHGESRSFAPFERFAQFKESRGKTLGELLETFATLREENLRTLAALNVQPDQLQKRGTHPELATVTVQQLIATWVVHDLGHIAQIARVMAKRYRDDVGPWRAYLRVIAD